MSDFDPDKFLNETDDGGFDPDKFLSEQDPVSLPETIAVKLGSGATLGFIDELQGVTEGVGRAVGVKGLGGPIKDIRLQEPAGFDAEKFKQAYREARDAERSYQKRAAMSNPNAALASEITGAVATGKFLPLGQVKSLGSAVDVGARTGVVAGLGNSEAEDAGGMLGDAALGGAVGATLGAGGYGAAKGIEKGVNKVGPAIQKAKQTIGEALKVNRKSNADEIEAAARTLGVKPTPGMVYDHEVLQGLESSLSQSPSIGGMLTRKGTKAVEGAIDDVSSKALSDATSLSPFEIGERVKSGIERNVTARAAKAREPFEKIAESAADIAPSQKALDRVAKNIEGMKDVQLMDKSSWASKARQYSEALKKAKSVADITKIRQLVGKELETAEGPERLVLGSIYERMGRLEESSIIRGAAETMKSMAPRKGATTANWEKEGSTIGKDMVSQFRGAKKDWRSMMNDLREVSEASRISRPGSPTNFVDNIDAIRSERVGEKLFNTGDVNLMRAMQSKFPDEAALLREGRLGDIKLKSSTATGELSTPKFLQQTKNIGDEAMDVLFNPAQRQQINASKTVMNALPEYIGPSGTPKGHEYLEMLNPIKQAADLGRYAVYKTLPSKATQRVADYLLQTPRFQKMAAENPQAFRALVLQMHERVKASPSAMPKAAENELDQDSGTPSQYFVPDEEAKERFLKGQ